ncbi:hypothetical protein PIB30_098489 [Stylosanthes scabra]|uniref:Glycosyltransferase n=1 Tax=Stylosanthes scabra TaxID=79078 RepID=A0ABU6QY18_9FABA|nr:hypothetical protein [Stylosanthes scabra]
MGRSSSPCSSSNNLNLHFVFIPLMAPGHLIPMVDMAKLLARRNIVKVTIVTTLLNSILFKDTIEREAQSGSPIQIQLVPFPNAESGIPDGCESLDSLPSVDLTKKFIVALGLMQRPLEDLYEKLTPTPCCIIYDKHIICVADIARKFNVPRILFDESNCFHLLCNHNLHLSKVHETLSPQEMFLVPGIPERIGLRRSQLSGILNPGADQELNAAREQVGAAEAGAYGMVVNTFDELEMEYVKEYKKISKIWCVGPVSLSNKNELEMAIRSKRHSDEDGNRYMKWLDSWPPSSVVYVCLGSLNRVTPEQLIELGLGLEATNRPFIWVLRCAYRREEMDTWLSESGFEERVKGRGILIKGWVPQVLILSHKSIGAFLTHCGWNSTLEGICASVPLVTFPLFEEKHVVQVTRENVKDAIEKVMGQGEECHRIRLRARKYGTMAKRVIEEGGSSYCNMSRLIEDIVRTTKG